MPEKDSGLIPAEVISSRILLIRGERVMLDADLAALYGVETKRLNEQVRRNKERFPADFMFQLNAEERKEVVANCDHLSRIKFSSTLPYAFTEHGIKPRDALHLGCAVYGNADCFITCDDKLLKRAQLMQLPIQIINPVNFTYSLEVGNYDTTGK